MHITFCPLTFPEDVTVRKIHYNYRKRVVIFSFCSNDLVAVCDFLSFFFLFFFFAVGSKSSLNHLTEKAGSMFTDKDM